LTLVGHRSTLAVGLAKGLRGAGYGGSADALRAIALHLSITEPVCGC
jgi:hypothetical protein